MKLNTGQKVLVLLVVAANVVLWVVPSDVVELIARDRTTLLGRYSRTHFYWNATLLPVSLIVLHIGLARRPEQRRKRAFHTAAIGLVVVPVTCAADLVARSRVPVFYVKDTLAYHRPPDYSVRSTIEDRPEAARTYPVVPPGSAPVHYTLHADKRGFRNRTDRETYDVVALGDSFTEGSRVSDEHPWPARLAERSGLTVYNLGMSGYAPQNYLASLKEVGLPLRPHWVVCVLYEENDFRKAKITDKPPRESSRFFKRSPILYLLDRFFVRTLAPVNARGPVKGIEILSWLPLAIPEGPDARHYTFEPKQLVDPYEIKPDFEEGKRWRATIHNLEQMQELCRQAGAELIVAFAPSKAHVVLPLVRERLDAKKVHAFAALRAKKKLSEPRQFLSELYERLDTVESAIERWCRHERVAFVSLTLPLRRAAARAQQVYLTYNDHWTPLGHQVAAEAIHDFMETRAGWSPAVHEPTLEEEPAGPTRAIGND